VGVCNLELDVPKLNFGSADTSKAIGGYKRRTSQERLLLEIHKKSKIDASSLLSTLLRALLLSPYPKKGSIRKQTRRQARLPSFVDSRKKDTGHVATPLPPSPHAIPPSPHPSLATR